MQQWQLTTKTDQIFIDSDTILLTSQGDGTDDLTLEAKSL